MILFNRIITVLECIGCLEVCMLEIKFKPKSKDEEQKSIMDNEGRDTLQNP